ncbi:RIP metalloprotease RseP [Haloferula sp. BvORR071]|uniref:RIP metalloprotease RseP n=1 Tax=Haloferula sp. BvORR071 TaxID=1396141 RepID=UPI0006971CDD|nr:RIP metalloprotease RseP [Haloferula sp. BvORR071]
MEILLKFAQTALLILVVIAVFNLIIFVHELGHYWAAKWRGLKIDRFQIWFGKPIWSKTINGVQYGLGWIPAGGFVALPQMAPMEAIEGGNLDQAPLPPIKPLDKIIVAFAGPLFSFLLAITAALCVWQFGKPADMIETTTVGYVEKGSAGEAAGLKPGDKILAINGSPVSTWVGSVDSVVVQVATSRGSQIQFTVDRGGEVENIYSGFKIPETKPWQRKGVRQVGLDPVGKGLVSIADFSAAKTPAEKAGLKKGDAIVSLDNVPVTTIRQAMDLIEAAGTKPIQIAYQRDGQPGSATVTPTVPISGLEKDELRPMIGVAFTQESFSRDGLVNPTVPEQLTETVKTMWLTIVSVVSKDSSIGLQHLSGPIGIGKVQYNFLLMDHPVLRIIAFLVLININLAILNLLPFPVLDGGHIVLAGMEWIAKRPVRVKLLEYIQLCFVCLLFGVMIYVSSKDVFDDFGRGGGGDGKRKELVFPD